MMRTIRVGTRGSNLALWQANFVQSTLEQLFPDTPFERVIIKTEGDRDQHSSLTQIGGQGVFTKEIEDALLSRQIDIAVHSLKDLPSNMSEGLFLGAVPKRGPVEDVLVTQNGQNIGDLPEKARVATGSIRRRSQLLKLRPDLIITDLRGNIDTRLRKLEEQDLDAIIMAKAAIVRLKLDHVRYTSFSTEEMIPGVGQGAVGIQVRSDDEEVKQIVSAMSDNDTLLAVTAERAFLQKLDSGCQFPVGGYAEINGGKLKLTGYVGNEDGSKVIIDTLSSDAAEASETGKKLAEILISKGAMELLKGFMG